MSSDSNSSSSSSDSKSSKVKDKNVKDKKEKVKKDKKEVELHVLVANQLSWKPEAWKAIDRGSTASVGFIKVSGETTLASLRPIIKNQIRGDSIPTQFVFLKQVGRGSTVCSPKQERTLKAKDFVKPHAEICILSSSNMVFHSRAPPGGGRPVTPGVHPAMHHTAPITSIERSKSPSFRSLQSIDGSSYSMFQDNELMMAEIAFLEAKRALAEAHANALRNQYLRNQSVLMENGMDTDSEEERKKQQEEQKKEDERKRKQEELRKKKEDELRKRREEELRKKKEEELKKKREEEQKKREAEAKERERIRRDEETERERKLAIEEDKRRKKLEREERERKIEEQLAGEEEKQRALRDLKRKAAEKRRQEEEDRISELERKAREEEEERRRMREEHDRFLAECEKLEDNADETQSSPVSPPLSPAVDSCDDMEYEDSPSPPENHTFEDLHLKRFRANEIDTMDDNAFYSTAYNSADDENLSPDITSNENKTENVKEDTEPLDDSEMSTGYLKDENTNLNGSNDSVNDITKDDADVENEISSDNNDANAAEHDPLNIGELSSGSAESDDETATLPAVFITAVSETELDKATERINHEVYASPDSLSLAIPSVASLGTADDVASVAIPFIVSPATPLIASPANPAIASLEANPALPTPAATPPETSLAIPDIVSSAIPDNASSASTNEILQEEEQRARLAEEMFKKEQKKLNERAPKKYTKEELEEVAMLRAKIVTYRNQRKELENKHHDLLQTLKDIELNWTEEDSSGFESKWRPKCKEEEIKTPQLYERNRQLRLELQMLYRQADTVITHAQAMKQNDDRKGMAFPSIKNNLRINLQRMENEVNALKKKVATANIKYEAEKANREGVEKEVKQLRQELISSKISSSASKL